MCMTACRRSKHELGGFPRGIVKYLMAKRSR
jgi:hypothetical protein